MNTNILKVIVGSKAHGLATPESDTDYRGVFVVPTVELLKIGGENIQHTSWIEGKEDDTSWEIGKFLLMAVKCNPTVLETFLAPQYPARITRDYTLGDELQDLFQYVWNSDYVYHAFVGYGINQRKKFFDNKDKRAPKYAAAYLRVLFNACELLETGTFHVDLRGTEVYDTVKRFKEGNFDHGEVIQACWDMQTRLDKIYKSCKKKETNLEPINEYLLRIRKRFWEVIS